MILAAVLATSIFADKPVETPNDCGAANVRILVSTITIMRGQDYSWMRAGLEIGNRVGDQLNSEERDRLEKMVDFIYKQPKPQMNALDLSIRIEKNINALSLEWCERPTWY